jgi:8-oxo-dGTP diphosphatase
MRRKAKILFEFNGNILVLKPTNKVKMTLIGGSVNRNETPIEAAIREAAEEAGIFLAPEDLRTYICCDTVIRDKPALFYCFLIRNVNVLFELKEKHKFELIGWMPVKEGLKKLRGVEREISTKLINQYIANDGVEYSFKRVI